MADSNGKSGRDSPFDRNMPLQPLERSSRDAFPPPPGQLHKTPAYSAARLADMLRELPHPSPGPHDGPPDESTFSFPPPSVPAPPAASSISPVALAAESIPEEPRGWRRPSGKAMAAAAALTAIATLGVVGGFSAISARASAAWDLARSNAASQPAVAVLPNAVSNWPTAPSPQPANFIDSLPAFVESLESPPDMSREAPREVKVAAARALAAVLVEAAKSCQEPGMAPVSVKVTAVFNSWGEVEDVAVNAPDAASQLARCLARETRSVRLDGFDGASFRVSKVITVR